MTHPLASEVGFLMRANFRSRRWAIDGPGTMSTGGEVANAQVCKTCIRGFETRPVLQFPSFWPPDRAETSGP